MSLLQAGADRRPRSEVVPEKRIDVETTAQSYLALLRDRGIKYFFGNAGTDFAPIIEAFARCAVEARDAPIPITVPHENAAVAMAYGYYMITGEPQAVMVHVNVGAANALNGIINASRDRVPILFTAGRTPITEAGAPGSRNLYIHWAQETFDQAAMVREYVKWDYELRQFSQLEQVVDRALKIAMVEPRGPVYLTLPREVLSEPQTELVMSSPPRRDTGHRLHPDPQAIEAAASALVAADHPLIVTTMSGRDPRCVPNLVKVAESLAIPVIEFNRRAMCFPTTHPLHLGFSTEPFVNEADVIVAIESDVPWLPCDNDPPVHGKVIHIGVDPLYARYPMRSFPSDILIQADPAVTLQLLADALTPHRETLRRRVEERFQRLKSLHDSQRDEWRAASERARDDSPLDPHWISRCIDDVKDDDTIIVNEYDLVTTQVELTTPGTFFGSSSASGLGWGLGAALGAKLAAPERLVIATVGDGAYMFGNPTPCHFVSHAYALPVLTIIFNNKAWGAVQEANSRMYPEGRTRRVDQVPLSTLEPSPHFELLVKASGGYAERVARPEEVRPALERALRAVRNEGRQAVLNMVCKSP